MTSRSGILPSAPNMPDDVFSFGVVLPTANIGFSVDGNANPYPARAWCEPLDAFDMYMSWVLADEGAGFGAPDGCTSVAWMLANLDWSCSTLFNS